MCKFFRFVALIFWPRSWHRPSCLADDQVQAWLAIERHCNEGATSPSFALHFAHGRSFGRGGSRGHCTPGRPLWQYTPPAGQKRCQEPFLGGRFLTISMVRWIRSYEAWYAFAIFGRARSVSKRLLEQSISSFAAYGLEPHRRELNPTYLFYKDFSGPLSQGERGPEGIVAQALTVKFAPMGLSPSSHSYRAMPRDNHLVQERWPGGSPQRCAAVLICHA